MPTDDLPRPFPCALCTAGLWRWECIRNQPYLYLPSQSPVGVKAGVLWTYTSFSFSLGFCEKNQKLLLTLFCGLWCYSCQWKWGCPSPHPELSVFNGISSSMLVMITLSMYVIFNSIFSFWGFLQYISQLLPPLIPVDFSGKDWCSVPFGCVVGFGAGPWVNNCPCFRLWHRWVTGKGRVVIAWAEHVTWSCFFQKLQEKTHLTKCRCLYQIIPLESLYSQWRKISTSRVWFIIVQRRHIKYIRWFTAQTSLFLLIECERWLAQM